ncbi:hypothetical protein [Acetivibrio straminisolvens]|uniref:Uncharacterized protein n=1 Tax=Acetivibrio straminisolvens JCM 21531 TaxID=1294263 RepID=W4VC73_9FIRM|nr:hypothetical protein [Acetivibrio straminisolvens]GAE90354.1 hypothetical protein JCM21531_3954 [Acetivibrio straminisolvens JCM 21531]
MQGMRIKWGNVIIFLLIIAAAVAAFILETFQRTMFLLTQELTKIKMGGYPVRQMTI